MIVAYLKKLKSLYPNYAKGKMSAKVCGLKKPYFGRSNRKVVQK